MWTEGVVLFIKSIKKKMELLLLATITSSTMKSNDQPDQEIQYLRTTSYQYWYSTTCTVGKMTWRLDYFSTVVHKC
jgi:hypothetical protein